MHRRESGKKEANQETVHSDCHGWSLSKAKDFLSWGEIRVVTPSPAYTQSPQHPDIKPRQT